MTTDESNRALDIKYQQQALRNTKMIQLNQSLLQPQFISRGNKKNK